MRIVITGALGHIGSSLIKHISCDELVLVDNFYTNRYCSLFNSSGKFIEADIMKDDLENIFKGAWAVIHLAAITDASSSFNNAELVNRVNLEGTREVAKACAKTGSKLIFASTTSIYGQQDGMVDETCNELKPQSPYAQSKYEAEQMLAQIEGLRYIILRMGTIFGVSPGMRFHTAVNKFCLQASINQPISVWRTALRQNRPYLDLCDMVDAIKFILDKDIFDNSIYNLVTLNTSVEEILLIIASRIPININYVDSPIMNQLSYSVSNKKFMELGFQFRGDLEMGIHDTLDTLAFHN